MENITSEHSDFASKELKKLYDNILINADEIVKSAKNKPENKEEKMIPKDAYILICSNDKLKDKIIHPIDGTYIYDFKEVEEYIKKYLAGEYSKITICKNIDTVAVEIKSVYQE